MLKHIRPRLLSSFVRSLVGLLILLVGPGPRWQTSAHDLVDVLESRTFSRPSCPDGARCLHVRASRLVATSHFHIWINADGTGWSDDSW